ncbi:MAG: NfeD family protein [Omnitrophica WOR_2 bacterium]
MSKRIVLSFWLLFALFLVLPSSGSRAQNGSPVAVVLTASGPLTPSMGEYLQRGIRIAQQRNAEVVIFELDTPGGSLDLMEKMIQTIRASTIPVIVYVYPRGAMAGSAGTLITLAGHASAMSPDTAIGAASPVGGQGEDLNQTESAKVKSIMEATVREIASHRKPQAIELAQQTIESAKAASAQEALNVGMVDFIASDVNDLLRQLNGFTVEVNGSPRALHTANAEVVNVQASFIEELLQTLTNPNIVFILLTIGVQAILIELSSPGGWVAGFIGAICVTLAAYGMGVLSVNWFGLIFLVIAFVLFLLDIKAPTHGALTAAGTASLIVGALVLFNSPGTPPSLRVSPLLVVVTSLATALSFGIMVSFAVRAQHAPVRMGRESVIGQLGTVQSAISNRGTVQLAGELWTAEKVEGEEAIPRGSRVQVIALDGNKLVVRKVQA